MRSLFSLLSLWNLISVTVECIGRHFHAAVVSACSVLYFPLIDLCRPTLPEYRHFHLARSFKLLLSAFYFARGSGCEVLRWVYVWMYVCLSMCLSVWEHISGTTCAIFTKFLCMLPISVARSSGMFTIGRITYRREVGDGSARRGRHVINDCLVPLWGDNS